MNLLKVVWNEYNLGGKGLINLINSDQSFADQRP